jgi:hypothetical protein
MICNIFLLFLHSCFTTKTKKLYDEKLYLSDWTD